MLAIESKWTTGTWALRDGALRGPIDDPVDQVLSAADRLERFLDSRDVPASVTPVLVVWGNGCEAEMGRGRADGVLVLSGPDVNELSALLGTMVGHRLTPAAIDPARTCIARYLENNPETKAADRRIPRLVAWMHAS